MKEIWKDIMIEGFEDCYEISSLGVVKSKNKTMLYKGKYERNWTGRIRKQFNNHRGYPMVLLSKDGYKKTIPTHILLAKTFLDNPENKKEVNHKDGNKENNSISNLEWCTRQENMNHSINVLGKHHAGESHYNANLSVKIVLEMRRLFDTGKYTKTEIGRMFNVGKDHAINIINNKCWKTLKTV